MDKKIVCIVCPIGCNIDVEYSEKEIQKIEGAMCNKGKDYVKEELYNPTRLVPTSVLVENGELPLVSVKTDKPVPKKMIMEIMNDIKKVRIKAPVKIGDIIIENIKGTGANIVATKDIDEKGGENGKAI